MNLKIYLNEERLLLNMADSLEELLKDPKAFGRPYRFEGDIVERSGEPFLLMAPKAGEWSLVDLRGRQVNLGAVLTEGYTILFGGERYLIGRPNKEQSEQEGLLTLDGELTDMFGGLHDCIYHSRYLHFLSFWGDVDGVQTPFGQNPFNLDSISFQPQMSSPFNHSDPLVRLGRVSSG